MFNAKLSAISLLLAGALLAGGAQADRDELRAFAEAKISLIEAIEAAESAEGGKAYEAAIDDDSFRAEYEVGIVREERIYEVRIDATTGEVTGVREDTDE